MKVLLAYDGSLQAKKMLQTCVQEDKESGNRLIVLNVFNSGLFVDYDAIPGAEEMARRESAKSIEEARLIILEAGARVYARIVEEEGVLEEEIIRYAETEGIDLLLCPKRYNTVLGQLKKKAPVRNEGPLSALFTRQAGITGMQVQRYL